VSDEVFTSKRGQRLEDFIRKVRSEKPTANA
jgi:hypothetical protein